MRGPNFTLDQLIEQEDLFQRGLELNPISFCWVVADILASLLYPLALAPS